MGAGPSAATPPVPLVLATAWGPRSPKPSLRLMATSNPQSAYHQRMQASTRRVVWAGMIGNVLEWYDFGLYGLLAPVLASAFYPGHNHMAALLGVYGGFAAGFAMRPIGAVVLGRLGDQVGRRFVLVLSVALMGAATVAVGVLPGYAALGLWAPIGLAATRLFQGFSVGGEYVGSVTYLVEAAPPGRRGLAGSVANLGATVGMLLAAAAAALASGWASSALAIDALPHWAWRVPFLLGGALAFAGYWLRRHLPESGEAFAPPDGTAPLLQALRESPRTMLWALLLTSGYGIVNYLAMVFLPTFAHEFGHVLVSDALRINTAGQALAFAVVPLSGWLSDVRWRRRAMVAAAFLGVAAVAWISFAWAGRGGLSGLWAAQLLLAGLLAVVMGAAPAFLAEQFPPAYRVSAHAVVFNIGIGIAGGTAPLVAVALIAATANPMAAAYYLIFGALLAAAGTLALHDHSRDALDHPAGAITARGSRPSG